MYGSPAVRHKVAGSEALEDYVAKAACGDGRKTSRFQRGLAQLIREHARRPQVEKNLGLVYKAKARTQLTRVWLIFHNGYPTRYG